MKIHLRPDLPPVTRRERLVTWALIALMLSGLIGLIGICVLGLLVSGGR